MANTINNGIPFVPENTIDPAAGLNASLVLIDLLLQLRVVGLKVDAPPASPSAGDRFIIGTSPTGSWAGRPLQIAQWMQDGYWVYANANFALFGSAMYVKTQTDWVPATAGSGASWGEITGTLSSQADLFAALNAKEYTLSAGSNITIDRTNPLSPVISSSGGGGGGGGDVVGPASSVDGQISVFSGATGKLLKTGVSASSLALIDGVPFRAVTTSATLVPSDSGRWVVCNNSAPITLTISAEASGAWPAQVLPSVNIVQAGAGDVTIAGSGFTVKVHASDTRTLDGAGSVVTAIRTGVNDWTLFGRLSAL